ncbi:hypothetical protein LJC27_06345 [Christensenellaceae bacterium OttesenSCG-928-M15]|nr:hypothetical protein [Christensenellaceae bacterium OttesenSCG-928-M15]
MYIKPVFTYKLRNSLKGLASFYGVLLVVFIGLFVLQRTIIRGHNAYFGGLGFASIIFMFVAGITAVSEELPVLVANGVSRKSQFVSSLLDLLTVVAIMVVIETVFTLIATRISNYHSMFSQAYSLAIDNMDPNSLTLRFSSPQTAGEYLESILWYFSTYCLAFSTGFFIASYVKRFSKRWRVWAGIGLAVVVLWGLPLIDHYLLGNTFSKLLASFYGDTPLRNALFQAVFAAALSAGGFLLFRRISIAHLK